MLHALTAILCCQLVGEGVVAFTGLPVPGPVVGMVLLFLGLLLVGNVPTGLAQVGDGLLQNLSLLFVPAGVGVMLHLSTLREEAVPLTLALVISSAVGLVVTALAMRGLSRLTGRTKGDGDAP